MMITGQTSREDGMKNNLSFQQMISCDEKELGCGGGNILQATRYVWEHDNFKNGNFGGLVSYGKLGRIWEKAVAFVALCCGMYIVLIFFHSTEDWPYSDFMGETTTECAVPEGVSPKVYLNYPKIVSSVNDRSGFEERRDRLM